MIKRIKHGFLKAAGIMLAVMMLAACVISGTLAKYTSTGTVKSGSLSLSVASWDIEVTVAGDVDEYGEPITHKLSDLAPDSSEVIATISKLNWEIYAEDSSADPPAAGTIAPGTWGYAEIFTITNKGDVDAEIKISGLDAFFPESDILTFGIFVSESVPESVDEMSGGMDEVVELEDKSYRVDRPGKADPISRIRVFICFQWAETGEDARDTEIANKDETGRTITFGSTTLTITATQAQTAS